MADIFNKMDPTYILNGKFDRTRQTCSNTIYQVALLLFCFSLRKLSSYQPHVQQAKSLSKTFPLKVASLKATLDWNYDPPTEWLTNGVDTRATSIAKNQDDGVDVLPWIAGEWFAPLATQVLPFGFDQIHFSNTWIASEFQGHSPDVWREVIP